MKISDEEVGLILQRMEMGESVKDLAHEYGVTSQYLYLLKSRSHGKSRRSARTNGTILSVCLRSGPSIFVGIHGNVLDLNEMDRAFLFRVADLLRSYEKSHE